MEKRKRENKKRDRRHITNKTINNLYFKPTNLNIN